MKLIFFSHPIHANPSPSLMSLALVKVIATHILHTPLICSQTSLPYSPYPVNHQILRFYSLKCFKSTFLSKSSPFKTLSSLESLASTATLLISLLLLVLSMSCFPLISTTSEWCFSDGNSIIYFLDIQCLEDKVQTP